MPRPGRMTTERAKDFKGTMKKLLGYLGKFLPGIILVLCCAAVYFATLPFRRK